MAVAAWWWRHPTVFDEPEARSTVGMGERRPADEGPIHLAMVRPQDAGAGSAALSSAEPHVLVNTARARIDLRVCERRGTDEFLSYAGGLEPFCASVRTVEGATLTWNKDGIGDSYVVMTIRPRRVGEVRVERIDLTYTRGRQSGTQQVGDHVWFRYVRPENRG